MKLTFLEKAVTQQICPRKRFLKYHWGGTGLEPVKFPVRDLTEHTIRRNLEALLIGQRRPLEELELQSLLAVARAVMESDYSHRGAALQPFEDAYQVFLEQSALVEAVLRAFTVEVLPHLDGYQLYKLPGESCPMLWQMEPGLTWAMVPEPAKKSSKEGVTALRFEVVSALDEQQLSADLHSMETIATAAAFQEWYGLPCTQRLIYILIGQRRRGADGLYKQASPFVRGYTNGMRIHWARRFENQKGQQVTLGKEWTSFPTWVASKEVASLKDWVEFLAEPANDVLKTLFRTVEIGPPGEDEIKEWKREIINTEPIAEEWAKMQMSPLGGDLFPMYRHSCDFCPDRRLQPCEFQTICYGDPAADPLASLEYQRRNLNLGEKR